jgi:hypothetical protein
MFGRWWERKNDGTVGWTHGFAGCTTFDVGILDQKGVIDHVVNLFREDAGHVSEIQHHPYVGGLWIAHQFTADFCFKSIPVPMKMSAFAGVVWDAMSSVRFDPAAYRGGHDSSSSKVKQTELMQ